MNYKDPNVNAGYLPVAELVAPSQKNTRRPSEKLLNWETNFIDKCCEGTKYPSRALKSQWALILAEKRVRNMKPNAESKENLQLQQKWLTHYEEQIDGWVKKRISSSRQEGEASRKGNIGGSENDQRSSFALHESIAHPTTDVQRYAYSQNHQHKNRGEEKFFDDTPENRGLSVAPDLRHDTGIIRPISIDDEVFRTGSRLDVLAHLASLQQPLPIPANRVEQTRAPATDNKERPHSTSLSPTY